MPTATFSMVEKKCGIPVACGPAVRQFIAYYKRTGTYKTTFNRQHPDEDFVRMRQRISIRDILWYRQPDLKQGRVLDARPIFQGKTPSDIEATAHRSVLSEWRRKIKHAFSSSSSGSMKQPLRSSETTLGNANAQPGRVATFSGQERSRIKSRYKAWGLMRSQQTGGSSMATQAPFLNDESAVASADRDYDLAEMLAQPMSRSEQRSDAHVRPAPRSD